MFSMIVAMDNNTRGIGKDGKLLFKIKEDMGRFKEITMGKNIIMGRKTFESLPHILPGRKHIIVTRDRSYYVNNPNVEVWNDIDSIIACFMYGNEENVIIGGGEIYKIFLPFTDKIYMTETMGYLDQKDTPDTFFPELDEKEWDCEFYEGNGVIVSNIVDSPKSYSFKTYVRK